MLERDGLGGGKRRRRRTFMSEAYVECLVKAKTSVMAVFFKYLLIAIAAVSFLGILIGLVLAFSGGRGGSLFCQPVHGRGI